MSNEKLEKQSSAFTLSDMEIFIFPDLFYALVLANIMSPEIWKWRDDPWFKDIEKKSFSYKINRVKQYIMDHYTFNLDLETWGLTTKERELARFSEFITADALAQSNALFGYEGDKYYFSIDIRKHFGLDKYTSDIIPYWKTETVEAMNAFCHKPNYATGAGECVSLATMYAAAMFIVAKIPLEKIFLIATPLHSQNFITEKDGIITNNRRIVTKSMWYNGTMLSAKARRAIENEKITIVSHISGHIHTFYDEATISPEAYQTFSKSLNDYLHTNLTFETFVNFLRTEQQYWSCFQYEYIRNGKPCYVELCKIFEYERHSKNTLTNASRDALFAEIGGEEFRLTRRTDRLIMNIFEQYLNENLQASFDEKRRFFEQHILECPNCPQMEKLFDALHAFLNIEPRLPSNVKTFVKTEPIEISEQLSREEVIAEIEQKTSINEVAQLALFAARRMDLVDWQPFVKAVVERNPVCVDALKDLSIYEIYDVLKKLSSESIYDEPNRLAMPDEVWNFQVGDGLEKAFAMVAAIINKDSKNTVKLTCSKNLAKLKFDGKTFEFLTSKNLDINLNIPFFQSKCKCC
ncbi:MAG: hypothetical protein LBH22_09370 [Bacteroidales bacterium]|jgi:hypothetical protein|nr:hypothetical protein [Bacteroidales bacterium]